MLPRHAPAPGDAELLDLEDRVKASLAHELAPLLAAAIEPSSDLQALLHAPLGLCHAGVLRLRAAALGTGMPAAARCPGCATVVEFSVDALALAALADGIVSDPEAVTCEGHVVTFRPPSSADLAIAAEAGSTERAELALLRSCVRTAHGPDGVDLPGDALPEAVREAVAAAMAQADPLSEVLVDVTCPGCGSAFASHLDIATFVWAELGAKGRQLLLEVDALARAYGWSETEVLTLSTSRRAAYLQIIEEGTL